MVVTVGELDLELNAPEEVGRRVEDERVPSWLERVRETSATVRIRLDCGDLDASAAQLDTNPSSGASGACVEDMGGERGRHAANLRA